MSTTTWSATPGPLGARVRIEPGAVRVLVPESPVHLAERSAGPETPVTAHSG